MDVVDVVDVVEVSRGGHSYVEVLVEGTCGGSCVFFGAPRGSVLF